MSIYSPSNRLYTVNEEVNSTMSGGEPDTFSYSGGLRQGLRNHIARASGPPIPFPDKIIEEDDRLKIDEEAAENEEEDPGNVSETESAGGCNGAEVPTNLTSPRMIVQINDKLQVNMSYHPTTTGEHTRTNSSKA